ncbi:hypothetical protein FOA52_008867, partial [Chlamydomonas sp. UWO 241]
TSAAVHRRVSSSTLSTGFSFLAHAESLLLQSPLKEGRDQEPSNDAPPTPTDPRVAVYSASNFIADTGLPSPGSAGHFVSPRDSGGTHNLYATASPYARPERHTLEGGPRSGLLPPAGASAPSPLPQFGGPSHGASSYGGEHKRSGSLPPALENFETMGLHKSVPPTGHSGSHVLPYGGAHGPPHRAASNTGGVMSGLGGGGIAQGHRLGELHYGQHRGHSSGPLHGQHLSMDGRPARLSPTSGSFYRSGPAASSVDSLPSSVGFSAGERMDTFPSPAGQHAGGRPVSGPLSTTASSELSQMCEAVTRHAQVYRRLFFYADLDRDGRVTGGDAVQFFERSGLPNETLFAVWDFSASKKQGYLDERGFNRVMDCIALAQMGREMSPAAYEEVGCSPGGFPVPRMRGFDADGLPDGTEPLCFTRLPTGSALHPPPAPGGGGSSGGTGSYIDRGASALSRHSSSALSRRTSWSGKLGSLRGGSETGSVGPPPLTPELLEGITRGLRSIYMDKVRPIEDALHFGTFYAPALTKEDLDTRASVLLLGQRGTGKTTFASYLLGREYPGAAPGTDRFVVVHAGEEDARVPGYAFVQQDKLPYEGLKHLGPGFLASLEGTACAVPLLEDITLIDSPGLLANGDKPRRAGASGAAADAYVMSEAVGWFAERAELVLLCFDPHRTDISDELRLMLRVLRPLLDKVRLVLNKCSELEHPKLARTVGGIMWSLGRAFRSDGPEPCRLYLTSFNPDGSPADGKYPETRALLEAEEKALLADICECPRRKLDRRISELITRVAALRAHVLIVAHLSKQGSLAGLFSKAALASQLPSLMTQRKAQQKKLVESIADHFFQVKKEHKVPVEDFPDPATFAETMVGLDLSTMVVTTAMRATVDRALFTDIPELIRRLEEHDDPSLAGGGGLLGGTGAGGAAALVLVAQRSAEEPLAGGGAGAQGGAGQEQAVVDGVGAPAGAKGAGGGGR